MSLLDIRWMGLTRVGTNDLLLSRSSTCLLVMGFPLTYIAFCACSTRCFCVSLSMWAPSALCLLCISNSVPSAGMSALDTRHRGHGKVPRFLIQARSALSLAQIAYESMREDFLLLRVICRVCKYPWEESPNNSIDTFN